jgi:hypothetical protein
MQRKTYLCFVLENRFKPVDKRAKYVMKDKNSEPLKFFSRPQGHLNKRWKRIRKQKEFTIARRHNSFL